MLGSGGKSTSLHYATNPPSPLPLSQPCSCPMSAFSLVLASALSKIFFRSMSQTTGSTSEKFVSVTPLAGQCNTSSGELGALVMKHPKISLLEQMLSVTIAKTT